MRTPRLALAVLFSLVAAMVSPAALAQPAPTSNYTSFEATPDKPVQLGYLRIRAQEYLQPGTIARSPRYRDPQSRAC